VTALSLATQAWPPSNEAPPPGEAVGAILTIQVRPDDFCPLSVVG
jgi:hypothetical protein